MMAKKKLWLCIFACIALIAGIILVCSIVNKKEQPIDKPINNIVEAYDYVSDIYFEKGKDIDLLEYSETLPIEALHTQAEPLFYKFTFLVARQDYEVVTLDMQEKKVTWENCGPLRVGIKPTPTKPSELDEEVVLNELKKRRKEMIEKLDSSYVIQISVEPTMVYFTKGIFDVIIRKDENNDVRSDDEDRGILLNEIIELPGATRIRYD